MEYYIAVITTITQQKHQKAATKIVLKTFIWPKRMHVSKWKKKSNLRCLFGGKSAFKRFIYLWKQKPRFIPQNVDNSSFVSRLYYNMMIVMNKASQRNRNCKEFKLVFLICESKWNSFSPLAGLIRWVVSNRQLANRNLEHEKFFSPFQSNESRQTYNLEQCQLVSARWRRRQWEHFRTVEFPEPERCSYRERGRERKSTLTRALYVPSEGLHGKLLIISFSSGLASLQACFAFFFVCFMLCKISWSENWTERKKYPSLVVSQVKYHWTRRDLIPEMVLCFILRRIEQRPKTNK